MSFDGQVVRPQSDELRALYSRFIPVRITGMRGVDLNRWQFDYDLTLAIMVAHPDGTILHRYGSRDRRHPDHWLDEESYEAFLIAGLKSYADHTPLPSEARVRPKQTVESLSTYRDKDKSNCIHCHEVFPALRREAISVGSWTRDSIWAYPPPSRIGLDLHRTAQRHVSGVTADSPADRAGLRIGDHIVSITGHPVATASDLMAALHSFPSEGGEFPIVVERVRRRESGDAKSNSRPPPTADRVLQTLPLALAPGWKTGTARDFAWRASKWPLLPAPGFGGPALSNAHKKSLGIPTDSFAIRVQYLVTWGDNRRFGQAAARAGLRNGMIVLGTKTKRDFENPDHLHAWWRINVNAGEQVKVITWQNGEEVVIPIPAIE